MRTLGAIVHRGPRYGVVVALGNPHWDAVRVEWSDGTLEWVEAAELQWASS